MVLESVFCNVDDPTTTRVVKSSTSMEVEEEIVSFEAEVVLLPNDELGNKVLVVAKSADELESSDVVPGAASVVEASREAALFGIDDCVVVLGKAMLEVSLLVSLLGTALDVSDISPDVLVPNPKVLGVVCG